MGICLGMARNNEVVFEYRLRSRIVSGVPVIGFMTRLGDGDAMSCHVVG